MGNGEMFMMTRYLYHYLCSVKDSSPRGSCDEQENFGLSLLCWLYTIAREC